VAFFAVHISNLQRRVRSVGQRSAGAVDANTDTANQVAHAHKRAAPEKGISGVVVASRVGGVATDLSQFGREYDAHNDAVDGDYLAENNRDQVLGADSWRLDTTTEDRGSGNEDSPVFLVSAFVSSYCASTSLFHVCDSYHAAPTTDRPIQRPMPAEAQA
jgi:hypothetical protein